MQTRTIACCDTESQTIVCVSWLFSFNYKVNESLINDNWHHQFPFRFSLGTQCTSEPVIWSPKTFLYLNVLMFNWTVIALQYCTAFRQTSTWISHSFTYVPVLLNLPTFFPIQHFEVVTEKYGRLHKSACHPWAGVVLIFSVLFHFFKYMCYQSKHTNNSLTEKKSYA